MADAEANDPGTSAASAIDWNGPKAQFWADHDDRFDTLLARHGEALLRAAAPSEGEAVLDVGCGCGSTTLRAGDLVGAGVALGVDISQAMIDKARVRARAAKSGAAKSGAANVWGRERPIRSWGRADG